MHQSEQLETQLVLAVDTQTAAGLLIQRLPVEGVGNLQGADADADAAEHYNRISVLATSLAAQELLTLDADTCCIACFGKKT